MKTVPSLPRIMAGLAAAARAGDSGAAGRGVVTDEAGAPLAQVRVQICGLERFRGGVSNRVLQLGLMPRYFTDAEGHFAIPIHQAGMAYGLYFDKMNRSDGRASNVPLRSHGGIAAPRPSRSRSGSGVPGEKRPQFFEGGSKGVRRRFEGASKHHASIKPAPRWHQARRSTHFTCRQVLL